MGNKEGAAKNLSVVKEELTEWSYQMRIGIERYQDASLKFDKTNVLHITQNLVTETFRALPRTFGYLFSISVIASVVIVLV